MRKLVFIFSIILLYSCTATTSEEETVDEISPENKLVVLEFNTTQPNADEIRISYFDYKTNSYPIVIHQFEYDTSGESLPFIMRFENYDFRYISGEGYRNNPSTEEISVKLFVNDELVLEDTGRGVNGEYAEISFDYDAGK